MIKEYRKKTFVNNKQIIDIISKKHIEPLVIREKVDYVKYHEIRSFVNNHRDKTKLFVLLTDNQFIEVELHITSKI